MIKRGGPGGHKVIGGRKGEGEREKGRSHL